MGLPNIGPLELIIILAIALLIVGPGRLPEMGSAIGRTIREFRKASSDVGDGGDKPTEPNTLSRQVPPNTAAVTPAPADERAAEPMDAARARSGEGVEGDERADTTRPA